MQQTCRRTVRQSEVPAAQPIRRTRDWGHQRSGARASALGPLRPTIGLAALLPRRGCCRADGRAGEAVGLADRDTRPGSSSHGYLCAQAPLCDQHPRRGAKLIACTVNGSDGRTRCGLRPRQVALFEAAVWIHSLGPHLNPPAK